MPDTACGFVVAAPRSGEGKTTVCLALARALRRAGLAARCLKCGPDYVDPTLLARASGAPCLQVDTWLMGQSGVRGVYARQAEGQDVVLIEGVMGLLDGRSPDTLEGSTLDCARALGLPVLLCVNARGLAASLSALVEGFALACGRAGVRLAGVIATRTGSARHRALLEETLARASLPPLVCALPREEGLRLPSRQLGLVPADEVDHLEPVLERLGAMVDDADLERLLAAARAATPAAPAQPAPVPAPVTRERSSRTLAVARDDAFRFYYEDNLELLRRLGWRTRFFSPLAGETPPACDALYLGGGYPEVFAARLAANAACRRVIRGLARDGLPVFAECGGMMYLARALRAADGREHAMCGVIDGVAVMGERLRSLGYREARFGDVLPFGLERETANRTLRGHEFHWSRMDFAGETPPPLYMETQAGLPVPQGFVTGPAGNVLASWLHVWLPSLFAPVDEPAPRARLLVVTGPSSAGKSSLIAVLEREMARRGQAARVVSLDALLASFSRDGRSVTTLEEAERLGCFSARQYHDLLRGRLRPGGLVLCDHVLCGRSDWIADFARLNNACDMLAVELDCAPDELARREAARRDRPGDAAHALAQAGAQRAHPLDESVCACLHPDSGALTAEALARRVRDALAEMTRTGEAQR